MMSGALLSIKQVAELLAVSERTAWRLIREGRIPSLTIGSRRLVDPKDLAAFVEARKAVVS
jgi:excisionase family DNA binding protein